MYIYQTEEFCNLIEGNYNTKKIHFSWMNIKNIKKDIIIIEKDVYKILYNKERCNSSGAMYPYLFHKLKITKFNNNKITKKKNT